MGAPTDCATNLHRQSVNQKGKSVHQQLQERFSLEMKEANALAVNAGKVMWEIHFTNGSVLMGVLSHHSDGC